MPVARHRELSPRKGPGQEVVKLQLLSRLAEDYYASLPLAGFIERACERIRESLGARQVSICLLDPKSEGSQARERSADEPCGQTSGGCGARLCIALQAGKTTLGSLCIDFGAEKDKTGQGDAEQEFLRLVAGQLALLIENAQLAEAHKRAEQKHDSISRLTLALAKADTPEAIAQAACQTSRELWGCEGFTMSVLRGEPAALQPLLETGNTQATEASALCAPIRTGEESLGVLTIRSNTPRAFDRDDLQLLQFLADYAGGALQRTRATEALRQSEERYALALSGANEGLWDWDLRTDTIQFSSCWKSMLGFSEEEIDASPEAWFERVHPEERACLQADIQAHLQGYTSHFENEHRMRQKDNSYRWMLSRGICVRDHEGKPYRMVGSQADVTMRRNAEEQLLHGACHDALTGLANREYFLECLGRAFARANRQIQEPRLAVIFLDLDEFKQVNDSYGHLVGDQMLVAFARRLELCVRPCDVVARLGGDEFTILIEGVSESADAIRIAERLQEHIRQPFQLGPHELTTTSSIGIAFGPGSYASPEDLLQDADTAMYRAKARGKACYEMQHEMAGNRNGKDEG